ncbi:outer membrane protein OmpK [Endozoicomonas arenosclerae]|uniref:outer membrane protein OmpK n=1 Tax=Endozoicomonas arenosclerae TaxID=1633495 RepID=UPI0007819B78|nr:outer membrane protein OmpK [Endozoicomonas arenosclerae]
MKLLRNATLALAAVTAAFTSTANAEYQYGFSNVSISRLDWSDGTEERTAGGKKDFTYLELEGGAGFDWGEIYGFIDLENPHKSNKEDDGDGRRVAMKGTMRLNLGDTGFNLYGQVYDLSTDGFNEQNRVVGFGYNFAQGSFFFKPFIGLHNAQTTYFSGNNGYMLGWVLGYGFKAFGEDFMVTNWHETEFNRDEDYAEGKETGQNGAVSLWWNATDTITAGLQYRYADDKLGADTYQNAMIYTLKYNF